MDNFDNLRSKFSVEDKSISLAAFCALTLEDLNGLISEATLTRSERGEVRALHPSSQPTGKTRIWALYPFVFTFFLSYRVFKFLYLVLLSLNAFYNYVGPGAAVNMTQFKTDLENEGVENVDDLVLDRLLVTNATGVALASTGAQKRAVYLAAAAEPRSRTIAALKKKHLFLNGVHFRNDKTLIINALHFGKPSLLKIVHQFEGARLEVNNCQSLFDGHCELANAESFLGDHFLAGPYQLVDFRTTEPVLPQMVTYQFGNLLSTRELRGGVLMKHYSTVLDKYVGAGVDETLVLRWMEQTRRALDHIHFCGYGHGDIKPANILLDSSGDVRVCDLGAMGELGATLREETYIYRPVDVVGINHSKVFDHWLLAFTTLELLGLARSSTMAHLTRAGAAEIISRQSAPVKSFFESLLISFD